MKILAILLAFVCSLAAQKINPHTQIQTTGANVGQVLAYDGIGYAPINSGAFFVQNDSGTGTTINQLAKINSSGNAVNAATTDTAIPVYIVIGGAGRAGFAILAASGVATCRTDSTGITVNHFVVASTVTAGRCADAGSTAPTSGWVIGTAQSTVAANANVNVVLSEGYNAASGGSANPGNLVSISFASTITPICPGSNPSTAGTLTTFVVGALTGNITINNPVNCTPGQALRFIIPQDAIGGRTLTWGNAYGSTTQQMDQAANAKDGFNLWWDSSVSLWQFGEKTAFVGYGAQFTNSAPGYTPQSNAVVPYVDSSTNIPRWKDPSNKYRGAVIDLLANNVRCAGGSNADDAACSATSLAAPAYVAGGGSANAQTVTLVPAITSLTAGLVVRWLPTAANTSTTPTLTVNGLTATTIVKTPGNAALAANDLTTSAIATAIYDGTNFELQNPQTASGGTTYTAGNRISISSNVISQNVFDFTNPRLLREDFCSTANGGATIYSQNTFTVTGTGQSFNPASTQVCGISYSIGTTSGNNVAISLGSAGGTNAANFDPLLGSTWQMEIVIVSPANIGQYKAYPLEISSQANQCGVDFGNGCVGVVFRPGTDTAWQLANCASFTCSFVSTGVTVSATTQYAIILGYNGTASFASVNGSSQVTNSTNFPTGLASRFLASGFSNSATAGSTQTQVWLGLAASVVFP